jgi:hypothetical protein
MSRHTTLVPAQAAEKVFGIELGEAAVFVTHGFDAPCTSYFCDLEPDCEIGIYYGGVGLTKRLPRWDYVAALKELGLEKAAEAVAWDVPY